MTANEIDREFLATAIERGYFEVPRQTPLTDLADAHDISDVEASKRLQSGTEVALREYLGDVDTPDDDE